MATELMARSQIMSSTAAAMPTTRAGGLPRSGTVVRATGLKVLPSSSATPLRPSVNSKGMFPSRYCERSRARSVTRSVLEAPRVEQSDVTGSPTLNPAEVLIEKLAALGAPNDSELHKMSELADRLFAWDDVPKLGRGAELEFTEVSYAVPGAKIPATKQTFTVYELNEFDRDSPAFLELSRQSVNKIDPDTGAHIKALGDQVPFTNKIYDPTLKTRIGITTGICLHMKNYPGRGAPELHQLPFFTPDHYETIMSWYFGDMGHISGMGPFINFQDTLMGITGGTGFFAEARGVVRLHPITPFKFMYTFTISGIPELPKFLLEPLVTPHFGVESHPNAAQCKPGHVITNFTD